MNNMYWKIPNIPRIKSNNLLENEIAAQMQSRVRRYSFPRSVYVRNCIWHIFIILMQSTNNEKHL
jgi:hypothetical protein